VYIFDASFCDSFLNIITKLGSSLYISVVRVMFRVMARDMFMVIVRVMVRVIVRVMERVLLRGNDQGL
jgi:hypothetical protein